MKRFWWSWMLVFLLGLGLGRLLTEDMDTPGTDSPSFSKPLLETTLPTVMEPEPTLVQTDKHQGLPQSLQYTTLVAQELVCYDGAFLEDGSDEELAGIAALLLENTGTVGIEYTQVVMEQAGRQLIFDATYIPPRGKVLILEKNRAAYSTATVESSRCRVLIPGSFDWEKERIRVEPGEGFSLKVTNLTEETLRYVRIFYKQYDGTEDLHIGGITLSAVLPQLKPGETRNVTPYRYAGGYSSIVAVVVEE